MAAGKTRKTAKKPPARGAARKAAPPPRGGGRAGEIIAICAVAVAILLGIGIYTGSGGGVGRLVDGVFKGLFGFGAVLIPIAAAWLGVSMMLRRFETPGGKGAGLAAGLFLCVCGIAHAVSKADYSGGGGFADYMSAAFTSGGVKNGGLFGALIGDAAQKALGVAGAYIALAAAAMIMIILLTGISFIEGIIRGVNKAKAMRGPRLRPEAGGLSDDEYYYEEEPEPARPERAERRRGAAAAKPAPPVKPAPSRPRPLKDPKKATFTVGKKTRPSGARPRVLLVNEHGEFSNRAAEPVADGGPDTYAVNGVAEEAAPPAAEPEITIRQSAAPREEEDAAPGPEKHGRRYRVLKLDEDGTEHDGDFEPYIREPEITTLRRAGLDGTGGWPVGGEGLDGFGSPAEPDAAADEEISAGEKNFGGEAPRETGGEAKSDIERLKERLMGESTAEGIAVPENIPIEYAYPPVELLNRAPINSNAKSRAQILENSRKLEDTLRSFGVEAKVIEVSIGPTITRYELSPGQGVKVSKIAGLADDLALNLAAVGIRIEAPIPGKAAVGIEIPNKEVTTVYLREVIEDELFKSSPSKLAFALGKDIAGNTVITDIARMPHLLIAGATGSGKSVCVNTLITSIIYKADPNEVKLVMIDPKVVELGIYNGIPHLLIPVVTEPKKAAGALNWAVQEMVTRYNMFAEASVRDLKGYNALLRSRGEQSLPQIVIIIDELADLMMVAPGEVEEAICRLAQMARAAGLHLIIATQRPSVDVITGLIKANIPSRLAFAVSSGTDSRTILDTVGAEKLLGKGDMLFYPVGVSKPQRVQGAFVSDKEVENIVAFVKNKYSSDYDPDMISKITSAKNSPSGGADEVDELFVFAAEFIIEKDKASASMLQRQFRIGYNKAARLIEELEAHGVVGPEDGSKPRKVLMTSYQWGDYKEELQGGKP